MAAVVIANAAVLFAIPELAGFRNAKLDLGVVTFLREHLGLERMYTLGPLAPNYGAYFHVASINHNSIPIPAIWTRYTREVLDPQADRLLFTGWEPGPLSAREDAIRTHVNGFEATAVKYIVAPHGDNPFITHFMIARSGGPNVALPLKSGEQISGTIKAVPLQRISSFAVVVGTYGGAATGSLKAEICAGTSCSSGMAPLAQAVYNQKLEILLDSPLAITGASKLSYTLTHVDGATGHPVAIWIWPADPKAEPIYLPGNRVMRYSPEITLGQFMGGRPPQPVYRSAVADVYRLLHPAPYFDAEGAPCVLSAESRETLHASCKAPAVLLLT